MWTPDDTGDLGPALPTQPPSAKLAVARGIVDPLKAHDLLDLEDHGRAHEMLSEQVKRVRTLLLTDFFAFAYFIGGCKDLYPPLHAPVCRLMERWGQPGWRRMMVQIPRSAFKTSLCTRSGVLWQIVKNPNTMIAVFNEKQSRVERWFLAIQSIVSGNELFQKLFPEVIPPGLSREDRAKGRTMPKGWKWSSSEMVFCRDEIGLPEPTLTALGVDAASAGGHYDWLFLDDPISVEAAKSAVVMQSVKDWFDTIQYLGMTPETMNAWISCTRWHYDDVYEYAHKVHDFSLYRRGAIENGESIWPERWSTQSLLDFQARKPAVFASQMMNDPVAGEDLAFKAEWLRTGTLVNDEYGELAFEIDKQHYSADLSMRWDDDIEWNEPPPRTVPLSMMEKVLLVDPAPTTETERKQQPNARTAMILKGRDPWGRRFKLDMWAGREDPILEIRRMLNMCKQYGCDRIAIEEVVFSKLYKPFIHYIAQREGYPQVRYTALKPQGRQKETRIAGKRTSYEAGMEYMLSKHLALWNSEYLTYPYSATRDLLDAEAYDEDSGVLPRPESPAERAGRRYYEDPYTQMLQGRDDLTGY